MMEVINGNIIGGGPSSAEQLPANNNKTTQQELDELKQQNITLLDEVNTLKTSLNWNTLNISVEVTAIGTWFSSNSISDIKDAKEVMIICSHIGDNSTSYTFHLYRTDRRFIQSHVYHYTDSNGSYDTLFEVRWDVVNNTVDIRQTVKGTRDSFKKIYAIWYR